MGRKTNYIEQKNKFYIITNGEQTEQNYFKLLKAKRSIFTVKIIFENSDPIGLVDYAIKNTKDANQVWCVFDIDKTHTDNRLIPAIKKARENGINIAYSNIAFEVWLISHFEKCDKYLDIAGCKRKLESILRESNPELKYDKTDKELLKKYFIPKYKQAAENAKKVYQEYVKKFREKSGDKEMLPIWDWNSSTTVFRLIEALQLRV